jgi:hypothetical protein
MKVCLTLTYSLPAVLASIWCLEMKYVHRNWLDKTTSSLNTHTFDYCDTSLWPTTALTGSLITNVSYCHVGWISTSSASSSLLWTNELCNKRYLFCQTLTAKSLSCTEYEITQTVIPPKTLLQLQWHISEGLYNYDIVFNTSPQYTF